MYGSFPKMAYPYSFTFQELYTFNHDENKLYWSQKVEEPVSGPAAIIKGKSSENLDTKNMKSQVI